MLDFKLVLELKSAFLKLSAALRVRCSSRQPNLVGLAGGAWIKNQVVKRRVSGGSMEITREAPRGI